jgi:predicted CXXCH cytochrome family protein
MANVVRDPRQAPDAILPDLATNTVSPFPKEDVALVYGSRWKQRYFRKVGEDYFVEPAQWDVTHRVWRRYFVENGTDWWATLYPPDNMQRPTGPLCDGCHSVGYDVKTHQPAEWNVGCEQCHGAGSVHVAHPTATNIVDPGRMDDRHETDTCIQCHSQGRPVTNPIEGRYYDWPVGYRVGLELRDSWRLEDHRLGDTTFTHWAEGSAHKNRMQGNDFVQSVMYEHGVTCSSCHDAHGTDNPAQLRRTGNALCLGCHTPGGRNGPRAPTLVQHTGHVATSAGSECVACHMPKIATTIADVRVRSHTFRFVTPAMTDALGVPNPCTTCHADRSTAWATDALRRTPGRSPWRMQ